MNLPNKRLIKSKLQTPIIFCKAWTDTDALETVAFEAFEAFEAFFLSSLSVLGVLGWPDIP